MPATSTSLQISAKGLTGSKTWTIKNPVDSKDFTPALGTNFVGQYNTVYSSDLSLAKAVYIETTEDEVYPNN